MAALQTLRNKPALLMSVIGGALLLFIITMVLENQNSMFGPETNVGEIYGKEISIQDFEDEVREELNLRECMKQMQSGQALTEKEREDIRRQVWENASLYAMIAEEASNLGLVVSGEELQEALKSPTTEEVSFLMGVGSMMGNPTIDGYKQFLADFDKTLASVRMNAPENEEMIRNIHRACFYAEKRLQKSLLQRKYFTLFQTSMTANPVVAKMMFDERNENVVAEVASLSFLSVPESDVEVSDEDLKKKYQEVKELFRNPQESRCIKMIRVPVVPSPADRTALLNEVKAVEDSLKAAQTAQQIADIVNVTNTSVNYSDVYFKRETWSEQKLYDIVGGLDTMAVGFVKPTRSTGKEISTFKLVGKVTTPDSFLIKTVFCRDKAQADSILTEVKAGSQLGEIATQLGQQDTATWITADYYVGKSLATDSTINLNLSDLGLNNAGINILSGYLCVTEVLESKSNSEKFNIAVVKCPIEFSDETYNKAKSKLDNYLATNKTAEDFEKNAPESYYTIESEPAFTTNNYMAIRGLGGESAAAAVRWIFDEAEEGDVSNVFECGDAEIGSTLLAVALVSVCEDEYLPWDNESVKAYLTEEVKKEKRAANAMEQLNGVKGIEDFKRLSGVTSDTINTTLARAPYNDYALVGALAKAKAGETVKVEGANAAYAIKLVEKTAENATYNEGWEMFNLFRNDSYKLNPIFDVVLRDNGNVKDNRYKF